MRQVCLLQQLLLEYFVAVAFAGSVPDEEVCRVVLQTGLLADPGCDIGPNYGLETSDRLLQDGVYQISGTGQDIG